MKSVCRGCGEVFSSERSFSRHRTGEFTNVPPKYGRRCLSPAELLTAGWRKNRHGQWTYEREMVDSMRKGTREVRRSCP